MRELLRRNWQCFPFGWTLSALMWGRFPWPAVFQIFHDIENWSEKGKKRDVRAGEKERLSVCLTDSMSQSHDKKTTTQNGTIVILRQTGRVWKEWDKNSFWIRQKKWMKWKVREEGRGGLCLGQRYKVEVRAESERDKETHTHCSHRGAVNNCWYETVEISMALEGPWPANIPVGKLMPRGVLLKLRLWPGAEAYSTALRSTQTHCSHRGYITVA